jgi:hypothetical protein
MRSVTVVFAALAMLATACDKRPGYVKDLAAARLPALREHLAEVQKSCVGKGTNWTPGPNEWGAYASDAEVLNVQITCTARAGLPPMDFPAMHPPASPEGQTRSVHYVGRSEKKDPFPPEFVYAPSRLTGAPAVDLCVASGSADDKDFAQVCVAFKVAKG